MAKSLTLGPTPRGGESVTRRFNRNLAICAREMLPAEMLIEYLLAILEGHGQATLVRDGRTESGWRVAIPEGGGLRSSETQMQWAWTQLRQAGYGLPVQQIALEGELRTISAQLTGTIDLGSLPPRALHGIRDLIRGARAAELGAPALEASSPQCDDGTTPAQIIDVDPEPAPEREPVSSTDHLPGSASTDHGG